LIVITGKSGDRKGYEISAEPGAPLQSLTPIAAAPSSPERGGSNSVGIVAALGFALIGGLILNLMPCVFPVLSMKVLAFARRGDEHLREIRAQGWLFTLGVVASFLGLTSLLLALREAGAAIGWGYQLQSPIVILLLAYLMFVVGLALSGVLVIGDRLSGLGDSLARRGGGAGAFFTGVLAVLVATPCTAPFMGAALGYALIAPWPLALMVFLALGIGMALPFLVLSHLPHAFAWLPKPGPWMQRLKEFLAFPMYATAAWLLWVLSKQAGANALLMALAGLVLIGFAAWVLKFAGGKRIATLGRAAALAAVLSAIGLASVASQQRLIKPLASTVVADDGWELYTPERLQSALAAGQPVFIDATAAWCLTCKVNELGALSSRRVRTALDSKHALLLRADWTSRDSAVSDLLSRHGRLGVPLYVYYPKGNDKPAKILPQILTEDIVLDAIGG
jgi:thiol:disulfide interchange protein